MLVEHPRHRAQWQSHLGWEDLGNVNESRRHSLADIPTRRGSLAAGEPSHLSRTFTVDDVIEDEQARKFVPKLLTFSSLHPHAPSNNLSSRWKCRL